jgi:salicylate hydroxylase
MAKTHKILIAGTGIDGLAAAACLKMAGHAVEICEQAPALGEIGAGIQISANAMHVHSPPH